MSSPELSVVVLSWNTRELTLLCLRALVSERPERSREVVVVDNGSEDGSADAVAERFPQVVLLRNADNRLYAAGNNQGARAASGRYLCLLNSDTQVRPGALDRLVDFLAQHAEYGAVAPKLVNPDGSVQRACQNFPSLGSALCFDSFWGRFPPGSWIERRYLMTGFDHLSSRDVPQPPGACVAMNRDEYLAMGGLDEELALFFNDVDLCKRLWKAGRRIRYLADAEVLHHQGASTRGHRQFLVIWHRNRLAYYRKHYGPLAVPYLRAVIRLRVWEEWIRIGRRNRDKTARRSERKQLRAAVRELYAK